MADWLIGIGVVVAGLGAFLLSPLAGFLPVDLWGTLKAFFLWNSTSTGWIAYEPKVKGPPVFEFILIGLGLILVATGYYRREPK
jgi:hypothetical protein